MDGKIEPLLAPIDARVKLAPMVADLKEQRKLLVRAIAALEAYCGIATTPSTLPAKPRRGRPPGSKNRPKPPRSPAKTVLVVDDEPAILELAQDILHTAGFQVLTALDTAQALELCSSGTEQIDLLLTDIQMPQMTGIELARHLHDRKPGLPIVFMTGGISDSDVTIMAGLKIVLKPFRPNALVQVLQESLVNS